MARDELAEYNNDDGIARLHCTFQSSRVWHAEIVGLRNVTVTRRYQQLGLGILIEGHSP